MLVLVMTDTINVKNGTMLQVMLVTADFINPLA